MIITETFRLSAFRDLNILYELIKEAQGRNCKVMIGKDYIPENVTKYKLGEFILGYIKKFDLPEDEYENYRLGAEELMGEN